MSIGTITLTNSSVTVAGASTQFKKEVEKGDVIVAVVGEVTYTSYVKSVENDTSLTLVKKYDGPTQSGLAYTAIPRAAMQQITAQLASDTAKALRGLNYDKENWQAVFSQSRNITVKLPDGSTYEGPSWLKISDLLKEVDVEKLELLAKQVHEDAVQVSTDKVSANASAISSAKSATTADECAKKACECATKASQSEANAKASAASAKASETKSTTEANRAKSEADRAEKAADDAVAGGIKPSDLTQTVTTDKLTAPSNFAVSSEINKLVPVKSIAGELGDNPNLIVNQKKITEELLNRVSQYDLALVKSAATGINLTYKDITADIVQGVHYKNSTDYIMYCYVTLNPINTAWCSVDVGRKRILQGRIGAISDNHLLPISFAVPPNTEYRVNLPSTGSIESVTIFQVEEL